MTSTLHHEATGPDGIWRGRFIVNAGGYIIDAFLDLTAVERLARIQAGIDDIVPEPVRISRPVAFLVALARFLGGEDD